MKNFNPVGIWAVPEDDTKDARIESFVILYPDGSAKMLRATDCKLMGPAQWEFEYGMFTISACSSTQLDSGNLAARTWKESTDAWKYPEGAAEGKRPVWW